MHADIKLDTAAAAARWIGLAIEISEGIMKDALLDDTPITINTSELAALLLEVINA
jgi:hypothetical protein